MGQPVRLDEAVAEFVTDYRTRIRPETRSPRSTIHLPFLDEGVTYCGWSTDHGVVDGCGELWPCSTVNERRR